MDLHAVTVLFSLVFWGFLWGIVGALLAVPLTAILKIWFSHIDHPFILFVVRVLDGKLTAVDKKRKGSVAGEVLPTVNTTTTTTTTKSIDKIA